MVDDRHLLERQTKPQEFCAGRQEVAPPAVCRFDHGGVQALLVNKGHRQLCAVNLAGADQVIDDACHAQTVFAGGKAKIDFAVVLEHIPHAGYGRVQHIHAALNHFYRHIRSPHFGQMIYLRPSSPLWGGCAGLSCGVYVDNPVSAETAVGGCAAG